MNSAVTVHTLWLREIIRFRRNRSRLIGSMALPLLFLVVLGSGYGRYFSYKSNVSYMEYIGPGIIGMSLLFSAMLGGISVLWDRQFGFLKEILVAPVSRTAIMAGKTLGTVTTAMIKGAVFLVALVVAGLVKFDPIGILLALVFMFLISTAFVSLGIAVAAQMTDPHGFQLIMNFLTMPVFFLSGALFPLDGVPEWLFMIAHLNPLTYGVDGMRYALGGPHHFSPSTDFLVLLVFWGITTLAGALLFRRMSV